MQHRHRQRIIDMHAAVQGAVPFGLTCGDTDRLVEAVRDNKTPREMARILHPDFENNTESMVDEYIAWAGAIRAAVRAHTLGAESTVAGPESVSDASAEPVRVDIPGAWHYGLTGALVADDGEISRVRFDGHGTITVPSALVVPVLVHVTSATAIVGEHGETIHLAMCGEPLGDFREVTKLHPCANYIGATSPVFATVTCEPCRARILNR